MSLFLNNGSQSNPPVVVLLTPGTINEQLNRACQAFVDHTVKVRTVRRRCSVGVVLLCGTIGKCCFSNDKNRIDGGPLLRQACPTC